LNFGDFIFDKGGENNVASYTNEIIKQAAQYVKQLDGVVKKSAHVVKQHCEVGYMVMEMLEDTR